MNALVELGDIGMETILELGGVASVARRVEDLGRALDAEPSAMLQAVYALEYMSYPEAVLVNAYKEGDFTFDELKAAFAELRGGLGASRKLVRAVGRTFGKVRRPLAVVGGAAIMAGASAVSAASTVAPALGAALRLRAAASEEGARESGETLAYINALESAGALGSIGGDVARSAGPEVSGLAASMEPVKRQEVSVLGIDKVLGVFKDVAGYVTAFTKIRDASPIPKEIMNVVKEFKDRASDKFESAFGDDRKRAEGNINDQLKAGGMSFSDFLPGLAGPWVYVAAGAVGLIVLGMVVYVVTRG